MFIVIETFGGAEYAIVCTDDEGNNKVFDDKEQAEFYAEDCQSPVIIEIKD